MRRPNSLVLSPEQLKCLASPLRSQILEAGLRLGVFSVNELGRSLGKSPKALYPHVRQLVEVGVLVVDSERMAGKRLETLYAPASTRFSVDRTDRSPEFREAVAAGTRLMLRLVGREYAAHNKNGDSSLEATIRLNLRLSPGQIHQLRQKLMEIGDWASSLEEEGGEVDVNLTAFLIPKD